YRRLLRFQQRVPGGAHQVANLLIVLACIPGLPDGGLKDLLIERLAHAPDDLALELLVGGQRLPPGFRTVLAAGALLHVADLMRLVAAELARRHDFGDRQAVGAGFGFRQMVLLAGRQAAPLGENIEAADIGERFDSVLGHRVVSRRIAAGSRTLGRRQNLLQHAQQLLDVRPLIVAVYRDADAPRVSHDMNLGVPQRAHDAFHLRVQEGDDACQMRVLVRRDDLDRQLRQSLQAGMDKRTRRPVNVYYADLPNIFQPGANRVDGGVVGHPAHKAGRAGLAGCRAV